MKALATVLGAAALSVLAAVPAAYAGSKTINNNTPDTIKIIVTERNTDCSSNAGKAHITIQPNSQGVLNYSSTYINAMEIELTDSTTLSKQKETFTCTSTGGSGTLDNEFNANSIFNIGFASGAYGITFTANN